MIVNFSMYGSDLDCIDVLSELQNLPYNYQLWENEEELKEENGFTLYFGKTGDRQNTIPFSFGKFLMTNRRLLADEIVLGKNTTKELSVIIEKRELQFYAQHFHLAFFTLKPSFSNLLAELGVELNISTEL